VLSASLATASPAQIITDLSGNVRIQQGVPCGGPVGVTTKIAGGRVEITPSMTRDGILFDLTRLNMFLTPFSVRRACRGVKAVASFSEIGVGLAGAVRFRGELDRSRPRHESDVYRFVIPKEQFLIQESVVDNAPVRQPETAYQRPSEDVTGFIEVVGSERATMTIKRVKLRVVLTTQLHFRAGCTSEDRCLIDEIRAGRQISQILARPRDKAR
jgi:hypothetical protein